jgi:hypothetical protein
MIARAGLFRLERGERAGLGLSAHPSMPLPSAAPPLTPAATPGGLR